MPDKNKKKVEHCFRELIQESVGVPTELIDELAQSLGLEKQTVYKWYSQEVMSIRNKYLIPILRFLNEKRVPGAPKLELVDLIQRRKYVDERQLMDDLNLSDK